MLSAFTLVGGISVRVDVLLDANVLSRKVLHGQRSGPSGTPSALETCFKWVLSCKNTPRVSTTASSSLFLNHIHVLT